MNADVITDEEIRELRDEAWEVYAQACRALGFSAHGQDSYVSHDERATGRARCVEILKARDISRLAHELCIEPSVIARELGRLASRCGRLLGGAYREDCRSYPCIAGSHQAYADAFEEEEASL